jgi:hypothetical protein
MNRGSNNLSMIGHLRENFSSILELWIIIYELTTNYPRLSIKSELIINKNYFIILFQRNCLNSIYGIEFIKLSNLFKLLQILQV